MPSRRTPLADTAHSLCISLTVRFWRVHRLRYLLPPLIVGSSMTNVLFICSRNQWHSPTAEAIWRRRPGLNVRSAGTSPNARKSLEPADIRWADVVFVMERKHRQRLLADFARLLEHKPVHVIDILTIFSTWIPS